MLRLCKLLLLPLARPRALEGRGGRRRRVCDHVLEELRQREGGNGGREGGDCREIRQFWRDGERKGCGWVGRWVWVSFQRKKDI